MTHPRAPHRRIAPFFHWVLVLAFALAPMHALAQGKAKHVLIVVMDGLRRDTITQAQMPTLYGLSKTGTFFAAHHSIYPSSTQVNATALATGCLPRTSDISANREYRPNLELLKPIDTNDQYFAWKADQRPGKPWIHVQTLPEIARAAGLTTTVAGTKEVAILWDRRYANRTIDQPTLFEGKAIPSATLDKIIADEGPFPTGVDWKYTVNTARDIWTVRALTEKLWAERIPALTVLWLYEPDFSQHGTGVGSKNAKLAYKSSDDRLATVLETLEKKGVRDQTDIIIASDHGCSTISRKIDVADLLRKKGHFKAEGVYHKPPEPGNIVVTGVGGSVTFTVIGHDPEKIDELVRYLQGTSWAGAIFTKEGGNGTFKLADIAIDSPDAPDVVMSLRWKDEISQYGTPGTVICDGMDKGQGMHVSLSRYDIANTLIAVGPDFKTGVSVLPSANVDVAPTVAHILGMTPARAFDGRVLGEAMVGGDEPAGKPVTEFLRARRELGEKIWMQYLKVTTFDGRRYYDEGNVGAPPSNE